MIAQRYRTISIKETESINKCLDIALVNDVPYIITGGVENKLYIYNFDLELLQEIKFNGWIRSCSVVDLDNDLNQELIIGSGDNTLRVFKYIDSQFEELWHY
ncbi:MAG: hypothetical protein GY870_04125, partial [archaeon]|nr:hypothetical protein [archaeon]